MSSAGNSSNLSRRRNPIVSTYRSYAVLSVLTGLAFAATIAVWVFAAFQSL